NRPTDGTPFGGYRGWVYLRIRPFGDGLQDPEGARRDHAIKVSRELTKNLGRYGIQSLVEWEQSKPKEVKTIPDGPFLEQSLSCPSCDTTWNKLIDCIKDSDLIFSTYHPCVSDFAEGYFVFKHKCEGLVYIPVSLFVRKRPEDRNLINLNACPGYCHYKDSIQDCLASCEGSRYRRLARKLLQRRSGPRQNQFHLSLTGRN
ncbi:MAG: hypothetical protein V1897_13475, partial [Pseudomonadota bacterium]